MCSADVKDQVGSVPGSPGYACQIHQTPIAKRQAATHHQTPQSFRVNQFTTLHQNNSRPMVVHQSNTMHHSPTIGGHNLPAAFLTSRPSQQRRDTFTDLMRGTFTDDLAIPQRPMLGASFMPEFETSSSPHQRLHHSQGNIYAEVEHDYEVDSGFTEESVDLTSESRSNRAAILRDLDHHPRSSRSKPYLGKNPANPVYSSDDSELDQARRQFLGRSSERRVWKQEEPEDVGGRSLHHHHERLERYDKKAAIQHQGVSRGGHCALHSLYTVARDGL